MNLGGRISSSNLARLLASRSALAGKKVVICDNSEKSFLKNAGSKFIKKGDLQLFETSFGIDVLKQPEEPGNTSFFTNIKFEKNMTILLESYDQIFITPQKHETIAALNKLKGFNPMYYY